MEKNNADHGNDQEKLFTQEEVNAIIRKRLERFKVDEANKAETDATERAAALDQREADLNKRALRLDCKDYLSEQGYDADLFDVISADSFDDFKTKADKLAGMINDNRGGTFIAPLGSPELNRIDPLGEAFKAAFAPNYKHDPADPLKPVPQEE